jgi:hypothetical protein
MTNVLSSQGGASGCTASTASLATPTRNLQNIKDKHADQNELREENIAKPIHEKRHRCDWQRARAANDRYVIVSHVRNVISF